MSAVARSRAVTQSCAATRPVMGSRRSLAAVRHLVPALLLITACGAAEGDASAAGAGAKTPAQVAAVLHPCDAFSVADVLSMFGAAGDTVAVEGAEVPGNSYCSYSWKRVDWEEADARNYEAMMRTFRGAPYSTPETTEHTLTITFHGGDFTSQAHALLAFEQMIANLSKGVSATANGETFEFQTGFDPSEGVADRAAWSDRLRQVSAVSGTNLYHVMLRRSQDPGADRADAETIARKVGAQF
jgi:hypothetical protein